MWHSILFSNYIIFFSHLALFRFCFFFLFSLRCFFGTKITIMSKKIMFPLHFFSPYQLVQRNCIHFTWNLFLPLCHLGVFIECRRNEQLYKWILIRQYVYWRTDVKISVFVIKPLKCLLDTLVFSTFYDATWDFLAFDVSLIW